MSVLIKGMKMPNSCRECKLRDDMACCLPLDTPYEDRWVGKNDEKREPDCPLIALPDHGDLVEKETVAAILKLAFPAADYDGLCRATQALQ